jgi:hypothetical protein
VLNLPFAKSGRFYRGNLHTHTDRSDGALSAEAVVGAYRNAGYDFLALTDHFQDLYDYPITDSRGFRDDRFTTIIGAELTGNLPPDADGKPRGMDLVALGLPFDFPPMPQDTPPAEQAKRAAEAGAYVAIAHPAASRVTVEEALTVDAAAGIELFNGTVSRSPFAIELAETLLNHGRRLTTFASDDAHFRVKAGRDHGDFLQGWVYVRSESLEPDSLLAAIKSGDFYSSQGPQIHAVELTESGDGLGLRIVSSPVISIDVSGALAASISREGNELTFGFVPINVQAEGWLRISVTDAAGRRAWTNPFRVL